MKTRTEVVVIGGGILGCGVAYELSRLGLSDVVLLEKNELTAGTTWHSAGHLLLLDDDPAIARINALSLQIYTEFQSTTGEDIGLHQEGSIRLATTRSRLERLQRLTEKMAALGHPSEMIGPDEIKRRFPLINLEGVYGANWSPREGRVDPSMVTHAFARLARRNGVEIHRQTPVIGVVKEGAHWRVKTPNGELRANHVIVAAGFWTPDILRGLGIGIPILPAERQYLVTEEIPELGNLSAELPILRDFDVPLYFRQEGKRLLMGVHEPHTPFCFEKGIPPDFGQELLPPDLDRGSACIEAGILRVPKLGEVGIRKVVCGPTSRTVDFNGLLGPVPGHRNLHLLAGFSAGIGHGAAVTRLLAEWLVEGAPSLDVSPLHASRFGAFATPFYIRQMLGEAHTYGSLEVGKERQAGRRARTSPLYHRHRAAGAVFTARRGWECASCFPVVPTMKPAEAIERELSIINERCGLADRTACTKIEVTGPGAEALLRHTFKARALPSAGATTRIDRPLLAHEATVSVTLANLGNGTYFLVFDPEHGPLALSLLMQNIEARREATVRDVSGMHGTLAIAGPEALTTMASLVSPRIEVERFSSDQAIDMEVGYAPARVLRYRAIRTDVWEVHAPLEYLVGLDELMRKEGAVADVGFKAFDQLLAGGHADRASAAAQSLVS
jgi:dimethylglycine dehydrogenase